MALDRKKTVWASALSIFIVGFSTSYAVDWRVPGSQKEAVCQGSCGGGCGACPAPRQGSEGADGTQVNAAKAKANALNNEGIAAWSRGEWGIAREKFQQAYANNPDSKVIFTNLVNATHKVGQEDIAKGDWENAKNTFQSALYHMPNSAEFQRLYAIASQKVKEQRQQWADERQKDQQYDRAREQYKLGVSAGERGDWVAAENFFRTASQIYPDEPAFRKNVAWAITKQGDQIWKGADTWDAALVFWKRALETDPENKYARGKVADEQKIQEERIQAEKKQAELNDLKRVAAEKQEYLEKKRLEQLSFIPSGNGLIGGTSWITGYNVPPDSSPELRAKAIEMLRQQTALAGIPYNEAIDFERFNFVLGIAASTTIFTDLRQRVLFDNLTNGQATPQMQNAYSSLKGRSFKELDCHSNGAMICLAALENWDIKADRVVLYGPQITTESLAMWQELIQTRRVRSVQIYINKNDPVPAVSMLFGSSNALEAGANLPLFNANAMSRAISEAAPSIGVKVLSCGGLVPTLDCHDLRVYKRNRGCNKASSGKTVPGTSLPGGSGLLEPPAPC